MDLERHALSPGRRPALIVVDMSRGFTDPDCPLGCECQELVSAARELLDAFRQSRLPIYFTTVIYHQDEQARIFRQRIPALNVLKPGCPWVEIDSALGRLDDEEIIVKSWASAFFGTELEKKLKQRAVDSLVVIGLTTSGCVRATVVDGLQHEYPVFVPREAVGDRNPEAHDANLHDMNAKYADVVGVKDVLAHLKSISTQVQS